MINWLLLSADLLSVMSTILEDLLAAGIKNPTKEQIQERGLKILGKTIKDYEF